MKKDIHPQYNPVVFVDITTGRPSITFSESLEPIDKQAVRQIRPPDKKLNILFFDTLILNLF